MCTGLCCVSFWSRFISVFQQLSKRSYWLLVYQPLRTSISNTWPLPPSPSINPAETLRRLKTNITRRKSMYVKIEKSRLCRLSDICVSHLIFHLITFFNKKIHFRFTRTYFIRFVLPVSTSVTLPLFNITSIFSNLSCVLPVKQFSKAEVTGLANWILRGTILTELAWITLKTSKIKCY
jgi:hypothetical protein